MNKKILFFILFISTSCFEEDSAITPYEGSFTLIAKNIEYVHSYYDFESNSVISTIPVDLWALGFSCKASAFEITTNSGNNWFIFNTNDSIFSENKLPSEKNIWGFDKQSAFPDSTAIGNWVSIQGMDTIYYKNIYLLGHYSGSFYDQKYIIRFLKVTPSEYILSIRDFTSDKIDTVNILKNPNKNFVLFTPEGRVISDVEPDINHYDIIFSPYYTIATQVGITAPYLVRGVFLNSHETLAQTDSLTPYNNINKIILENSNFTSRRDIIGFNWKEVIIDQNSGTASYKIKANYSYIIQTQERNLYRMRFINYQLNGENGFPSFEFEKIP
jgi:hypothetical protein